MVIAAKSKASTLEEKTTILIFKCKKCGWSLRAPRHCLEINEDGFLCGRCFEKIEVATLEKVFASLID